MSVNTAHASNGVLIHSGEYILIHCDNIAMDFSGSDNPVFRGTKYGKVYLTSHRMIFNSKKASDGMQSFSAPFIAMSDVELEQPVFGANFIRAKVRAQPNGHFVGEVKFKAHFRGGGCIEYAQALLRAAKTAQSNFHHSPGFDGSDNPPPYIPSGAYYEAPAPAYQPPPGYYGWIPTHDAFTGPAPNTVFMSDNPPPYPGIGGPPPYQGPAPQPSPYCSPGQQPVGYPGGQPAGGYPGQLPPGYPGHQPPGYPGDQPPVYPGQQPPGYPDQQLPGYPGTQPMGYTGHHQAAGGYPGGPQSGGVGGYPGANVNDSVPSWNGFSLPPAADPQGGWGSSSSNSNVGGGGGAYGFNQPAPQYPGAAGGHYGGFTGPVSGGNMPNSPPGAGRPYSKEAEAMASAQNTTWNQQNQHQSQRGNQPNSGSSNDLPPAYSDLPPIYEDSRKKQ